jgi:hypothetical protein
VSPQIAAPIKIRLEDDDVMFLKVNQPSPVTGTGLGFAFVVAEDACGAMVVEKT